MTEQRDREGDPARQNAPRELSSEDTQRRLEQIRREGFGESVPQDFRSEPLTDSDAFMDPNARIDLSHVDSTQLAGNPFERKANLRNAFRGTGRRALIAAALAVAVLWLAWNLRPASTPDGAVTATPDGVVHLAAADPHALRQKIVIDLRAVGVDANGYEQLGVIGIDAELPRPLPPPVRQVLDQHRIPAPASGELRVKISNAKQR
jgi:hypothetical protein